MKKASLIFNLLRYYKILFFTSKIVFSQIITTRIITTRNFAGSGIKKISITRSSILENERDCLFLQFVVIVISVLSFRSDIN